MRILVSIGAFLFAAVLFAAPAFSDKLTGRNPKPAI